MAGTLKPTLAKVEGTCVLNGAHAYQGAVGSRLFDGIAQSYSAGAFYIYTATATSDYIDITLNQKSRLWSLPTTDYPTYGNVLRIDVWNSATSSWIVDTTKRTNAHTTSDTNWYILCELDKGRYRFSTENMPYYYSMHSEWYVEKLDEYYSIIKDNNTFYKFTDNEWINTNLMEPLNKQNFVDNGLMDLTIWTTNTNINRQTMNYERDLLNSNNIGKVYRKIIDLTKLKRVCGNIQKIESSQRQSVVWTSLVGCSANGNTLTKTGTSSDWDSGAISSKYFQSGNITLIFTATETTSYRMIGFNNSNANNSYTDIAFAWYLQVSGALAIYEKGTNIGSFGTYITGDVFKITYEGSSVKYYKNNVLIRTSSTAPVYPAFIDTSIYTPNGTLGNVVFGNNSNYHFIKCNGKVMNYNSASKQFVDTGLVEPLLYNDFLTKGIVFLDTIDTATWTTLNDSFEIITWTDATSDIPKLYFTTSNYNPIYWLDNPQIYTWADNTNNQTSMTIKENITTDTISRYLISKDNRNTWQYFDGNSFQNALSIEIFTKGMKKTTIESITQTQWNTWFKRGYIDLMIGSKTQNPILSPSILKMVTFNFAPNKAPVVTNFNITPNTTHNSMITISADVIDLEGDLVSYKSWVNENEVGEWSNYVDGNILQHITCTIPYNDLFNGDNIIKFSVKDDREEHYDFYNTIKVTNSAPYITMFTHDNWSVSGIINDDDSDKVAYRVLINGIQKYPISYVSKSETYSDWMTSPANIKYEWTGKDLIFGQINNINIEVIDEFHTKQIYNFEVVGKYRNLMLKDSNNQYFTDDMGSLINYINFNTIEIGQESQILKVTLENNYGYPVKNVQVVAEDSELEYQVCLCKDNLFLVESNTISFTNVMNDGDINDFYIKVISRNNFTKTNNNIFKLILKADKI